MASASGQAVARRSEGGEAWGLGKDAAEHARVAHQLEGRHRTSRLQEAQQLLPDPLAGEAVDARRQLAARRQRRRIGRRPTEAAVEAEEAEDAEIVLADPGGGVADEADAAGAEVGLALERVEEPALAVAAHGVDGEIAAGGVQDEVVGERDHRMPAVGGHVAAQRGHLVMVTPAVHGDGAVPEAGRDHLEPGRLAQGHDALRQLRCGEVEVRHVDARVEQRVAHAAADEPRRPAARREGRQDTPALGCPQPARLGQRWRS